MYSLISPGERCKINIDECESSPCLMGGTCLDGVNGYECRCIPGLSGANCEVNEDECASSPCLHGSQCIDQINRLEKDAVKTYFSRFFSV